MTREKHKLSATTHCESNTDLVLEDGGGDDDRENDLEVAGDSVGQTGSLGDGIEGGVVCREEEQQGVERILHKKHLQ